MIITDALRKSCTEKQLAAIQALINCDGNKSEAARELGISRGALRKHVDLVSAKIRNIDPSIENIVNIIKQNPNINGVSDMQVNEHGKPMWIKYGKRDVEALSEACIQEALGCNPMNDLIKRIDTNIVRDEAEQLFVKVPSWASDYELVNITIRAMLPEKAKREFMARYNSLKDVLGK